ncbi:MAG: ADP-forming succinate--CoA ligase subunit beta [bacterium]
MNVHEYQAKEMFRQYGVPVPRGKMCTPQDSIGDAARELGGSAWVIKAQVHAGGRGKGGGVKVVRSLDEAEKTAREMFARRLVTPQTGAEGRVVRKVLVEEALAIRTELYLSLLVDRSSCKTAFISSRAGGMDIEEVAAGTPEKIQRVLADPFLGLRAFQTRRIASGLGLDGKTARQGQQMFSALFRLFREKDASLVEINPLIVTEQGTLYALDAKLQFDDNALYRHEDVVSLRDKEEEDPLEVQAGEANVNYIRLDGNIGCMVNGAGLAMSTMDLIQYEGGRPANFLDVGGGASAASVEKALRIILADPRVKTILINIFGGIVRCDRVAEGVIEAAKRVSLGVPVVVRLEGTNAEEARTMLRHANLDFTVADSFREAARKAVALVSRAAA